MNLIYFTTSTLKRDLRIHQHNFLLKLWNDLILTYSNTLTLIPESNKSRISSIFSFSMAAISADRFKGSTQLISKISGLSGWYWSNKLEDKIQNINISL